MTMAQDKLKFGLVAIAVATLVSTLTACDSAKDESPAAAASTAQPAAPATSGEQMISIDDKGNIAPFGFASRKAVPVAELQVAAVATAITGAATSVVFGTNCVACHGPDAKGVQGLGVSLVDSKLVADSSPADLIVFLKEGRAVDSPDNVSGVPMPSFAWMAEADLAEVTAYLKSLNKG
jgi:mono/diheme cytochrome c family protein